MAPPSDVLRLGDGRLLAYDDVGDPDGVPVLYLHGTPDSRRGRHPDDGVATDLGVRLLAPDRPGLGGSSPAPGASLADVVADTTALLDHLDVEGVGVLAWSSGGLPALGVAAASPRVARVVTVGAVPPFEAYDDPGVLDALGAGRRAFVDAARAAVAGGEAPAALAAEVAPLLVPDPFDQGLAEAHVAEAAGELGRLELAAVPEAVPQLAGSLADVCRHGPAGLADDLARQLTGSPDLAAVTVPLTLVVGDRDPVAPPPAARWVAARAPRAEVRVVPGAGHFVLFPAWRALLRAAAGMSPFEPADC